MLNLGRRFCLTNQTICSILPGMLENKVGRLMAAYPTIYLACHRDHLRADDAGNTLTENQASVLDHLHTTRPATLSRLAEHMGVGRSSMSTTIARLVKGGYVTRKADMQDRRAVGLTLTPAGKRIQDQNTVLNPALVRQMFKLLEPAEADQALSGIERLAQVAAILLNRRKRERDG
jgi:DNA-binding MarR family transcriptional regulator